MDSIKQIEQLVKRITGRERILTHKEIVEMTESLVEGYDGSWRELALIADRLENIGKTINSTAKQNAYFEAQLEGEDGKHEFMGNDISLRTYKSYQYDESDPYLQKCEKDLEQVAEQLKPLKDREKSIKKSIKNTQKQQEEDGRAKLVEESGTIAISKS